MITTTVKGLFNQKLYRMRRLRAFRLPCNDSFFLHEKIFSEILQRKESFHRTFPSIAFLGYSDDRLEAVKQKHDLILMSSLKQSSSETLKIEDELLPFGLQSLDCIISTMHLHHLNDLPGVLRQIAWSLKPDGVFLSGFIGGKSLIEVRECLEQAELEKRGGITPRVSPMVALKDAGSLLQRAGFSLPVVDVEKIEIFYKDPEKIFQDLRQAGESSPLYATSRPLSRQVYKRTCDLLESKKSSEGSIKVTIEIIYMMGWAPHPSQQKALKPGSAIKRLAEVL